MSSLDPTPGRDLAADAHANAHANAQAQAHAQSQALSQSQTLPQVQSQPHSRAYDYDAATRAAEARAHMASADVDVAIRQLLDQQADIQTRLAALLATAHRRLDPALELDMLRHKVRILETVVDRHGASPRAQLPARFGTFIANPHP